MKFSVCIKSGTSNHHDYDNCDLLIQRDIETEQLPAKDNIITLSDSKEYLVTHVTRSFLPHGEFNTVYVIPY